MRYVYSLLYFSANIVISLSIRQFELSAALKVTTEGHVVEVLREEGPTGMHIVPLAERTGMEPQYLREAGC